MPTSLPIVGAYPAIGSIRIGDGSIAELLLTCGDLESQPIQVLFIRSLEELAHLLGKCLVLEHADPGDEGARRVAFQRNGKLEVRQVDTFNPNMGIRNDF